MNPVKSAGARERGNFFYFSRALQPADRDPLVVNYSSFAYDARCAHSSGEAEGRPSKSSGKIKLSYKRSVFILGIAIVIKPLKTAISHNHRTVPETAIVDCCLLPPPISRNPIPPLLGSDRMAHS